MTPFSVSTRPIMVSVLQSADRKYAIVSFCASILACVTVTLSVLGTSSIWIVALVECGVSCRVRRFLWYCDGWYGVSLLSEFWEVSSGIDDPMCSLFVMGSCWSTCGSFWGVLCCGRVTRGCVCGDRWGLGSVLSDSGSCLVGDVALGCVCIGLVVSLADSGAIESQYSGVISGDKYPGSSRISFFLGGLVLMFCDACAATESQYSGVISGDK